MIQFLNVGPYSAFSKRAAMALQLITFQNAVK